MGEKALHVLNELASWLIGQSASKPISDISQSLGGRGPVGPWAFGLSASRPICRSARSASPPVGRSSSRPVGQSASMDQWSTGPVG
eukprot:7801047-Pyramimonas_sp.AAC.1